MAFDPSSAVLEDELTFDPSSAKESSFDPVKDTVSNATDSLHRFMGGLTTGGLSGLEGLSRWSKMITEAQKDILGKVGLDKFSTADITAKGLGMAADVFGGLKQDVQTYSESKRNRERDPLFSAQLIEAGGNFAGQIATTAASKVAGLVNNVGQMFQQEYGAAKEKGADDLTAYQAGVYNLPAAFLDYFTESKMVKSLIPQQAKRTIAEVTKKIFTNAGLEGATEVIQDEYSNWLAGNALKYDQERAVENRFSKDNLPETGKQIAKTFAIGGILGGAATTAFEALQPAKVDEKGLAKEERLEALQKELDQINETQEKTQTSTAEFTPTISTTIPEVAGNAPSTAQSEITRISPEVRQLALDTEAEKSLTEAEQLLNEPEIAQDTVTPEQGTLSLEKEPISQPEAIAGIPSESDLKKIDVLKKATDVLKEDWESAPQIEVVADVSAIPDTALTPGEKEALKGNVSPDGLFGKDGKVYIIGDKVPNIQRVKELVLHETKAHYGFKSLFGGDDVAYKRAMQTALDEFNARPKMADALAARRGGFKDLADLVKAYDHLNVEHKEGKYAITEELLSRAAELYHDPTKARPTWFNRIISRIKLALQPIMPGMKLNDQDIINLLGTKSTELLDAASKKVETGDADIPKFSLVADKKPAPAVHIGDQEFEGQKFPFFNLTEDIPGHPKNSTVSTNTLIAEGFGPPEGYAGEFEPADFSKFSLVKSVEKPKFFSKLERVIEQKMPIRASAQQILGIINGAGVKSEEIKWIGLEPWLKDHPNPTKTDVLNYLKTEGLLQLKEVVAEDAPYKNYQLPGGENYREVVLTMPQTFKGDPIRSFKKLDDGSYEVTFIDDEIGYYKSLEEARKDGIGGSPDKVGVNTYISSHFPNVQNYVAHMRLNERVDAQGKPGLFIEEIQSDRHQQGREKGYVDLKEEANQGKIPDAPFRTTWPLQMFKRALRDAVESGKDWIGWTTGETQAERYDLSKQVDSIRIIKRGEDTYDVKAKKAGDIVPLGNETLGVSGKQLSDFVGKDLAKKAIEEVGIGSVGKEYSGVDLKVGGEGMKGFYDNILPKEIQKYVKQWGANVENSNILVSGKGMVGKGMLSSPSRTGKSWSVFEALKDRDYSGEGDSALQGNLIKSGFSSREEAEAWINENAKKNQTPIWKVNITPEMKASVESGQPLFSLVKKPTLRSFSERQKDNAQFEQIGMADLVEKIDSNYQAVSNKEGAQEAAKTLAEIGIAEAMDRVDSSETISARDRQYLGIAAMEYWNNVAAKAETQEDLDIASRNMVHVIESLARRGTEYGQAIQAMRGRLTPEGWIRTTLNQFKEVQAPLRKAAKEVVDELKKEVGSKEKQIKEVVEKKPRIKKLVEDLEKKSTERKKSETKEKKPKKEKFHDSSIPLWDQLKRAGQKSIQDKLSGKTKESQQGAINSFASDILKRISKQIPVKESLAKLSPEQKLKSLFQNWDKYKDYITNAYNDMVSSQSYEKLLDINTWMMEVHSKLPFLEKELKNLVLDGIKQAGSPTKVTEVVSGLADRLGMPKEQREALIELANEVAYPLIEKASTESAKKEIRSLKDIIFDSAKSKQLTVEALTKRLVDESGLTGKEAEALSKAVISAANAQIGHQAASYINRLKKNNSGDKKIVKAMKDDITKIMDYSISGVLDDETLYNHLAEKLNLPFYDQKFIQEVKKDAERIKDDGLLNKSPMLKNKAIYDLGNKIAKRTGTSNYDIAQAYWYASVLSGIRTQLKNFVGTAGQSQLNNFLLSADALRRGDKGEVMAIYSGWLGGLEKGVAAASDALLKGDFTGQYSFEAKKAASALEQISNSPDKWKRIISNAKYVSRLMAAADILNASANAESRARLKAYQLTKDVNLSNQDRQKAINEILHTTPDEIREAQLQAEQEGFKPESTTYRRRVNEILELQRPSDLNSEAREYGLLSTYNNEPNTNTLLGALAGFIEKGIASGNNSESDVVKLSARATRFLIPFTRIVANVGNEQLNYTPVGLLRLATLKNFNKDIETTQTDLTLLKAKILLGNGMLMGLAAMLSQWDDEDDPPFQIVGSGPSDFTKRSQWLAAGNKPWSIIWKDKKGKKHTATYTYSPFAMMLGVLGAYKDAQRYGNIDEKSAITKVAGAIANGLTVITDASFLSSVTSLMDVYAKRKDVESFSKGLVHQVARTAGGLAPNILKEFDSWFNKPLRDTKPSSFEFAAIFANQLPVIKDLVGKPMLNVLGEEIKNPKYPWQPFVESKEVDPIWTVLAKKQNDGVFISLPDAATKILPDGKRQTMTNKELYEYRKQYGQELKKTLIENMSLFENADPETSKKLLEGWSAAARATAKLNLNFF